MSSPRWFAASRIDGSPSTYLSPWSPCRRSDTVCCPRGRTCPDGTISGSTISREGSCPRRRLPRHLLAPGRPAACSSSWSARPVWGNRRKSSPDIHKINTGTQVSEKAKHFSGTCGFFLPQNVVSITSQNEHWRRWIVNRKADGLLTSYRIVLVDVCMDSRCRILESQPKAIITRQ